MQEKKYFDNVMKKIPFDYFYENVSPLIMNTFELFFKVNVFLTTTKNLPEIPFIEKLFRII